MRCVAAKSRSCRHRLERLGNWLLWWLPEWILARLARLARLAKRVKGPGLAVTRRLGLLLLETGLLRVESPRLGLLLKAGLLVLHHLRLLLKLWLLHLMRCQMLLCRLFDGIKEVYQIRRVILPGQTGVGGLRSRWRRRRIRIAGRSSPHSAGVACCDF